MGGALASVLLFNGCTPEQQALATGVAVGAVGAAVVYSYPYYYDRPYYYYRGHYYYGGHYHHGYYYHHGHRYHGGHYYHNGYRYHNGRRYRAQVGRYGYYQNREQYRNRHRYVNGGSGGYGNRNGTYRGSGERSGTTRGARYDRQRMNGRTNRSVKRTRESIGRQPRSATTTRSSSRSGSVRTRGVSPRVTSRGGYARNGGYGR